MTLREWERFFRVSGVISGVFTFLLALSGDATMAFAEWTIGFTCWAVSVHLQRRIENEKD